jgi:hypothetical protein
MLTKEEINEMEKARKDVGLPPLNAKVRKCMVCGGKFLSIEHRTCQRCKGVQKDRGLI